MPKGKSHKTPSYRLHKCSGQAYVTLNGSRHYLGRHDTPQAVQRYHTLIAEWLANDGRLPIQPEHITVVELIDRYFEFAKRYYRKADGTPTHEIANLRLALRPLNRLYGEVRVSDFGPRGLKTVRNVLIERGGSRKYVNTQIGRIKRMFKWAVAEELVAPSVHQALEAVAGLRRGRCAAKESPPVRPVPLAHVDAIKPLLSCQIRALIELQLLTAARPGELVLIRVIDIDASGKIWIYQPNEHKNAHHGHRRTIYLGPMAQTVIKPYLSRPVDAYLFSPREAERERRLKLHEGRVTPLSCGNRPGSRQKKTPRRTPRDRYDVASYRRAIRRACDAAGVPSWSPHRLRHNAGTFIRKEYGLDAARIILGHKSPIITEIYAEQDHNRALDIVSKIG